MATQPDAAPLSTAAVTVPRHVLAGLAAAARHLQVPVDPVHAIRAGRYPTGGRGRSVTYRCAPNCPVCAAEAILNTTPGDTDE